jgi:hypothetical protein
MSLPIAPFATLQATEERSSLNPFVTTTTSFFLSDIVFAPFLFRFQIVCDCMVRSAVTGKDALIGKTGPEYSPD